MNQQTGDEILQLLIELVVAIAQLILRVSDRIDVWGVDRLTQAALVLAVLYEIYLFTQGQNEWRKFGWIPGGFVLLALWRLLITPIIVQAVSGQALLGPGSVSHTFAVMAQSSDGWESSVPKSVIKGPVWEEVSFRFPIWWARRNGMSTPVIVLMSVVSSLIFASLHVGGTFDVQGVGKVVQAGFMSALGFGFVQCYLMYITESPLVVFVVHILQNAIAVFWPTE